MEFKYFILVFVEPVGGSPPEMPIEPVGAAIWVRRTAKIQSGVTLSDQDFDSLFKKRPANSPIFKFRKQRQDHDFA
jgi:hypothetical protein